MPFGDTVTEEDSSPPVRLDLEDLLMLDPDGFVQFPRYPEMIIEPRNVHVMYLPQAELRGYHLPAGGSYHRSSLVPGSVSGLGRIHKGARCPG